MDQNFKKAIITISVFLILVITYYGSYLPLSKSKTFISSMRSLGQTSSLDDFKKAFSAPLDISSPIGQEELVRQLGNVSLNIIQQNNNPKAVEDLVNYLENYYKPIIARNGGMSFSQDLYILGSVNELAFLKTNNKVFFDESKKYFLKALEFGPKRPQALYGVFDIYRIEGNVDGVKSISDQILGQWPGDERTKALTAEFLKKAADKTPVKNSTSGK